MIAEANKNIRYYEQQLKKSPDKCCRFCGQPVDINDPDLSCVKAKKERFYRWFHVKCFTKSYLEENF